MSNYLWLLCALGTALCWGAYGSAIHLGQGLLKSAWKAYFLVGVAYFAIAVVLPPIILRAQGDTFQFHPRGTIYAVLTGALGALGALFVILAMKTGGKPLYVMPLIFGLAPVMNVAVSTAIHPPEKAPDVRLYIGMVVLAAGAYMVLRFKPV